MATQNPLFPNGTWVQLNPSAVSGYLSGLSKYLPLPSIAEQTIGQVRGSFSGMNGPYYQVVWNPGSKRPKIGMYQSGQLCQITQQQAQQIACQMAQDQYTVQVGNPQNPQGESI
jgi:hypothetical protein